jgi:hypothetical protein
MEATDPRSQMPQWNSHQSEEGVADDLFVEPAIDPSRDGDREQKRRGPPPLPVRSSAEEDALDVAIGKLTASDPFDDIVAAARSESSIPTFTEAPTNGEEQALFEQTPEENTLHTRPPDRPRPWLVPVVAGGSTLIGAAITLALLAGPLGAFDKKQTTQSKVSVTVVSEPAAPVAQPLPSKARTNMSAGKAGVTVTKLGTAPKPETAGSKTATPDPRSHATQAPDPTELSKNAPSTNATSANPTSKKATPVDAASQKTTAASKPNKPAFKLAKASQPATSTPKAAELAGSNAKKATAKQTPYQKRKIVTKVAKRRPIRRKATGKALSKKKSPKRSSRKKPAANQWKDPYS